MRYILIPEIQHLFMSCYFQMAIHGGCPKCLAVRPTVPCSLEPSIIGKMLDKEDDSGILIAEHLEGIPHHVILLP
jgi:hypothetical protein